MIIVEKAKESTFRTRRLDLRIDRVLVLVCAFCLVIVDTVHVYQKNIILLYLLLQVDLNHRPSTFITVSRRFGRVYFVVISLV